jgi:hypothetical protein
MSMALSFADALTKALRVELILFAFVALSSMAELLLQDQPSDKPAEK